MMKKYGTGKDRIKSALACPTKGMQPSNTAKSISRGKNFKPKGMGGKK